jgi:transcriptional regulator with XRE-family HTH domain
MQTKPGLDGAVALRRWRRDARLTRPKAAAELGVSERMLAYYEAGTHPVPRVVLLAIRALSAGLDDRPMMSRQRWVALVDNLLEYGRGSPVVGRMLKAGDRDGLGDFLDFVRVGPATEFALTDPALFQSLRAAVTRAQMAGLGQYRVAKAA